MRNLLLLLILCSTLSPFAESQYRYYRGTTHTHTYPGSDADASFTPQKAVDIYKSRGYEFIAVTEHGGYWNAAAYSSPEMLVINGEEVGISGNGRWGHFTALNIKRQVTGKNLTHQSTIDVMCQAGALPFLNHPAYSQIRITARQVIDSMKNNLKHIEMYNGVNAAAAGAQDMAVWDSVLSTGRLLYGVACDDAHRESHVGKGWVMVRAGALHPDSITQAIAKGDFYPTTGIIIDSVSYSPHAVYVHSSNGTRIRFIGKNGATLATVDSAGAAYRVRGDEVYVRAEITNASSQKGWIQPMMVTTPNEVARLPYGSDNSCASSFTLYNNYPNPFNPSTQVRYKISRPGHVRLNVYDLLGRELKIIVDEFQQPGEYETRIDADDLSNGLYLYGIISGGQREYKKMLVVK